MPDSLSGSNIRSNRICLILIPEKTDRNEFEKQTKWQMLSEKYGFYAEIISYDWTDESTASGYYDEIYNKLQTQYNDPQVYIAGYENGGDFAALEAAAHTSRYTGLITLGGSGLSEECIAGLQSEPGREPLSVWIISPDKTPAVEYDLEYWNTVNSITGHSRKSYQVEYADELYIPPASKAGKIESDIGSMGIVLFSRKPDYYDQSVSESIARYFISLVEKDHVCFTEDISGGEIRPIGDPHFTYNRFQLKGQQRDYWMYLPDTSGSLENPFTLILCIHGNLESGEDMIFRSQWHRTAAENNCIVLYPSSLYKTGLRHIWQILPEEISFMRALIGRVRSLFQVDSSRIYVTGFSNGSSIAQDLIIRCSDIFAAVLLSAPAYYERDLYGPINEIHEAAALYSYGTEDEYLAANGLTPDIYDIPAQYRLQHWRKMYGFRQDSYEFEQTEEASVYTYRSLNNIPVCHWKIVKGKHHDYTSDEVPVYYEFLKHFTRGLQGELYYDGTEVVSRCTFGLSWDEYKLEQDI